ncbi:MULTISPECIES: hybrid sensor histidine kinase/response regulator [Nostocales]|uniref:histidine kinase n=3 Tax=Nostocales TaxID=1161 RepID=A0A0C1QSF6_9CYAN|nr:ATP-binding protein [Tolypothrix bouteillei]KAF3885688.1 hybrid sensor histidine kinase/response regulator [Tolypothrix bouteillei VB521301]
MNSIKILIVEDEQLVADDLRETLEYLGYIVPTMVATGEEAIVMVESLQPDLVLMDIRLAGEIDGVEASEQIQSRFNVPVVYLTANADRATLERVKATQPFGYILKPFDERILSTTIEIAISRHQAEFEVQKALSTAQTDKHVAQSQSQQKSQYLYMAAHEFRNPLTTIRLGAEILKHYGDKMTQESKENQLNRIQSATEDLMYLLEDILTLGQAETGKIHYEPVPMDLISFCREQVEALQMTVGNEYTIKFLVTGNQRTAYLDEKLLWHLLNNLLSNAIKYSPQGGEVSLILYWEDDNICFEVRDEGIGIPPEAHANLFEPFQRALNVGKIPGTGLGLAIVKQCVDMHEGSINFKSIVGQGTTFVVKLPVKDKDRE